MRPRGVMGREGVFGYEEEEREMGMHSQKRVF